MRFRLPGGKQQDLFAQIDHAKKLAARPGPLDKLAAAPGDQLPDKNTVWDFKELLGDEGPASIFEMFDRLLAQLGINGKEGIIVDASFVDVPRQRNSRDDNAAIKRGETPPGEVHHGYKNHVKSDVKTKLVRDYRVTPAGTHDSQCFEELVAPGDRSAYADSAYRSKESLAMREEKGIAEHLCEKGTRGNPPRRKPEGARPRHQPHSREGRARLRDTKLADEGRQDPHHLPVTLRVWHRPGKSRLQSRASRATRPESGMKPAARRMNPSTNPLGTTRRSTTDPTADPKINLTSPAKHT